MKMLTFNELGSPVQYLAGLCWLLDLALLSLDSFSDPRASGFRLQASNSAPNSWVAQHQRPGIDAQLPHRYERQV
jgi:hypothetical protein